MTVPSSFLICVVCGREALVEATQEAEGVISFPTYHCGTCPGYPQMAVKRISAPQAPLTTQQEH
jgi:transcription elongation factor Elf1